MIDDLVVPSANGTVRYVDDTTVYEVVDSREVSQAQNALMRHTGPRSITTITSQEMQRA